MNRVRVLAGSVSRSGLERRSEELANVLRPLLEGLGVEWIVVDERLEERERR